MSGSRALFASEILSGLPPVWPEAPLPQIQERIARHRQRVVVLDDDPTGTQTVADIAVLTVWDTDTLDAELARDDAPGFYILTNTRSMPWPKARAVVQEIAENLNAASEHTGVSVTVISRSDSTLRGYFPGETDTLNETLGPFDVTLLAPYFEAGGRMTIGDVHYVAEGDRLTPVGETPFAADRSFGFRSSNLREWVQEKSGGVLSPERILSLSLGDIRQGGPAQVESLLRDATRGSVCIVNAAAERDIETVALGVLRAEQAGRRILARTAASYVAARLGQRPRPLLTARDLNLPGSEGGGLILVGSYVPKTTAQLTALRQAFAGETVKIDVLTLLDDSRAPALLAEATARVNTALAAGRDALVFTSRALVTAQSGADGGDLDIGGRVSAALVTLLQGVTVRPRWVIAKGGITSSDLATGGLHIRRAIVRGQLLPGVPLWIPGAESRFPGMPYVVFPGNVGGPSALRDAVAALNPPK